MEQKFLTPDDEKFQRFVTVSAQVRVPSEVEESSSAFLSEGLYINWTTPKIPRVLPKSAKIYKSFTDRDGYQIVFSDETWLPISIDTKEKPMSQPTNTFHIDPLSFGIGVCPSRGGQEKTVVSMLVEVLPEDAKNLEALLLQRAEKALPCKFSLVATEAPKTHSIDWSQVNPKYDRIVTLNTPHGKRYWLRGEHPLAVPQTRANAIASFVAGDVDDTVYRP